MKKTKPFVTTTVAIVSIIGSIPGLWTIFLNAEGPFQRPDGPYWQALVIGIPSILIAVLIGISITKHLFNRWLSEKKSVLLQLAIIFSITVIAGLIAAIIGWEANWTTGKFFAWGHTARLDWFDLLKGIPIMIAYSIVPVGIAGFLNGLFSLIYIKFFN